VTLGTVVTSEAAVVLAPGGMATPGSLGTAGVVAVVVVVLVGVEDVLVELVPVVVGIKAAPPPPPPPPPQATRDSVATARMMGERTFFFMNTSK
jgi:hypothetical protein